MVHTNLEFETSNLILDFEFDQHLESHKHVINIIMGFREMGCYTYVLITYCSNVVDFLKSSKSDLAIRLVFNSYRG
jgi:hypothetical protein